MLFDVRYRMKKPQLLLVCILPVLLLGAFYVCRLGFHMHDAHLAGMLMILIGAALSVLTPTVFLLLRIFSKDRFPLGATFVFFLPGWSDLLGGVLLGFRQPAPSIHRGMTALNTATDGPSRQTLAEANTSWVATADKLPS